MARNLHVYPKAQLVDSTWTLTVKVYEHSTRTTSRFIHEIPAGAAAEVSLNELKISFDLVVDDTDTDQDVDDALFLDDIKPGAGFETVWSNWMGLAESIVNGLSPSYTVGDYQAAWSQKNTASIRSDARRALITQRGWSVPWIHWHEGNGTSEDGVG